MNDEYLVASLCRHIGETVTVFTASGGISGSGFTGVLASVSNNSIRLIGEFGGRPSCPLGSNCSCNNGCGNNCSRNCRDNILGSVTIIPVDKIVSFTHNAV